MYLRNERRGYDLTSGTSHRGPSVLDVNALRIRPQSTPTLYLNNNGAPIPNQLKVFLWCVNDIHLQNRHEKVSAKTTNE